MHSRRTAGRTRRRSLPSDHRRGRGIWPAVRSLGGSIIKSLPLDLLTIAFIAVSSRGLARLPFVPTGRRVIARDDSAGLVFGAMTALYLSVVKITMAAKMRFTFNTPRRSGWSPWGSTSASAQTAGPEWELRWR